MSEAEIRAKFGIDMEAENAARTVERLRGMSDEERGEELRQCLLLADAVGHKPDRAATLKMPRVSSTR